MGRAVEKDNKDVIEALLLHGSMVNAKNKNGDTMVHTSINIHTQVYINIKMFFMLGDSTSRKGCKEAVLHC